MVIVSAALTRSISLANAVLGTPYTATLTIVDNMLLTVQFSSAAFGVGGAVAGT